MASNHLRNCPKHRRPLPCPHCAAKVAVTEPEPLPTPKRRGRPPKSGVTMTAAERKVASRANKKMKQEDAERRNLVAELMAIYRRQQATLVDDGTEAAGKRLGAAREQRRRYHDDLMRLPVAELRSALKVQQEIVDSHGRLHNERSGARDYTELEHLHFKAQVTGAFTVGGEGNEGLDDGTWAIPTRPAGAGSEETDSNDEPGDGSPFNSKQQHTPTSDEKRLEKIINRLIGEMVVKDAPVGAAVGAKCPFCDQFFLSELGAANHLRDQYNAGLREHERFLKHLRTLSDIALPPGYVPFGATVPNSVAYQHYKTIDREMSGIS